MLKACRGASSTAKWASRTRFGDLTAKTGKNIQTGYRFLFMGAVSGIRNRDAQVQFRVRTDKGAFEELSFASMLMRRPEAAASAKRSG